MDSIVAKEIKKEPVKITYGISVDRAFCLEKEKKVFQDVRNNARIDGFRKGKVPEEIIRKEFSGLIKERTVEELLKTASYEILTEKKLRPLSSPTVDKIKEYSEGDDLSFEYAVEVMPEIDLKDYKGLKAEKPVFDLKDEDIEKTLESLRLEKAVIEDKNSDTVETGDIAVIDYKNTDKKTGKTASQNKNFSVEVETEDKNKFAARLKGMKKGESKTIDLENNTFDVTVKEIKKKVLPPLDDAFAKQFQAETVEALKKKIREEIELHHKKESDTELKENLIGALVEKNAFPVPPTLLEEQLHSLRHRLEDNFAKYGMTLEKAGMTDEKFREKYIPVAEKQVRASVLIMKVAEQEKIDVTDEEIKKEKERHISPNPKVNESVEKYFAEHGESVRYNLREEKTIEFLTANAKIKEVKKKAEPAKQ